MPGRGRVRADPDESGVEGQQAVDEGWLVGPRAGMDDQAGGLVHHVEVIVGVDQGHHDSGIGLDRGLDRRLVVDHDDRVVGHPVGGTALDPPVDLHGAGFDEVVGDRPATARLGRHPTVEALVGRGHQPP